MADEERPDAPKSEDEAAEEEESLLSRFPDLPPVPNLPDAPKLNPQLPPRPKPPSVGDFGPGFKMGLAMSAVTSFVFPILTTAIGGILLDRFLNTTPWLTIVGVLLGFVVGTVSLLNIVRKLGD